MKETHRRISEIIIHCSATKPGQKVNASTIDRWHRERGFLMIGYHYVILPDGHIELGRPLNLTGAHCTGHNLHSIGICYVGGLDAQGQPADTRTPQQRASMKLLVRLLRLVWPQATVHGHCEFAAKACPCFDVWKWMKEEVMRTDEKV